MSAPAPSAPPAEKLSSLARHSFVYSLAPLLQRIVAFALVRLYTSRLTTPQYGVIDICDVLFSALIQVCGTNLLSAVVRFYFDQKDERDRRAVVSSAILFLTAVSGGLAALGILFRAELAERLFVTTDPELASENLAACLAVVLATIPLALSSEAGFRYLQVEQRSTLVTTLRVSKSTLEMALKVYFLVGCGYGVIGFLLATLAGELITNLGLTAWVLRRVGVRFSWRVLSPMLVYAGPLILVGLCQMALNMIDRPLFKQLLPQETAMSLLGLYGRGYQVGWLVQLVVVGSFMQIWQPWIFGVRDEARRVELVRRVSTWALFGVALASIAVTLFGRELVWLLSGDPQYWPAHEVVPWVSVGYVFFALNGLSQVPLFIAKRTWPMFWLNLAAVVAKVLLSVALIPRWSYQGAAVATLITFLLLGVSGHVLASRLVGARFEHGRMAGMLALVLVVLGATLWIDARWTAGATATWTAMSALKAGLFLLVVAVVWGVLLSAEERGRALAAVRARLGR